MHLQLEGYPTITVHSRRLLSPSTGPAKGASPTEMAFFYLCLAAWLLPPLLSITIPFLSYAILNRMWRSHKSNAKMVAAQATSSNKKTF